MNEIIRPLRVFWEITGRCNLRCIHCYAVRRPSIELPKKTIFNIINNLLKVDVFWITFTGGEPFLRKDLIEIVKYAHDSGFKVSLDTNGTLVTEKHAKDLSDVISHVQISIDGRDQETHAKIRKSRASFWKAINAIKLFNKYNIKTVISVTLTKININQIEDILKLAVDIGASTIRFRDYIPVILRKDLILDAKDYLLFLNTLQKIKNKYPIEIELPIFYYSIYFNNEITRNFSSHIYREIPACGGGWKHITILPDGRVTPCSALQDLFASKESLANTSIYEVLKLDNFTEWYNFAKKHSCAIRNCPIYKTCGGGCIAITYYWKKYGLSSINYNKWSNPLCPRVLSLKTGER